MPDLVQQVYTKHAREEEGAPNYIKIMTPANLTQRRMIQDSLQSLNCNLRRQTEVGY